MYIAKTVLDALLVLRDKVSADINYPDYQSDLNKIYLLSGLPENVWSSAHSIAWESGHASGYYAVINDFFETLDLAYLAFSEGSKRRGSHDE